MRSDVSGSMLVRVGIHPSPRFGAALNEIGAAALISANALRRNGKFRTIKPGAFGGHQNIALDSAGFVAMVRYGGYPWTVTEYVRLAASFPWAWWASMDFCCEPEIAADRAAVSARIERTVGHLLVCRRVAGELGAAPPMPVLQGWHPDDYLRCADLFGNLPPLMGLGSVCRRNLTGPDGLYAILAQLDRHLPKHVRLHLFGVKGAAIQGLLGHPRIESVDSMAWDYAFRREFDPPRTVSRRIDFMRDWWRKQTAARSLFGEAA